jgi:hypothetical protein
MAPATAVHTAVTVGTGSTACLNANGLRRLLVLQNASNEDIYVNVAGGTAAASTGLKLVATTGTLVFDNACPTGAVTAICASGSKTLLVTEGS